MSKKGFPADNNQLVTEIKQLIALSHQEVAVAVNVAMSMLYWQVGKRINEDILQNKRAEYGKQVLRS